MSGCMTGESNLRYLDADHVDAPLPEFGAAEVRFSDGRKLGLVDGVVVDPAQRRALYLVIRRGGLLHARRELLPISDIQIEPDRRTLSVGNEVELQAFDRRHYPDFSDDDALTAIFATQAA